MPEQATFVDQEFLSDDAAGIVGDCWRACIANLVERPRDEVPHFVALPETECDWLEHTQRWLRDHHGLELHYVTPNYPVENSCSPHVIVVGRSPRGIGHAVLALAETGEMVHDPHPSRDGLVDTTGVFVLTEMVDTREARS